VAGALDSEGSRSSIKAPAPTGMPLLAAAGITLAFTGLVTSLVVTAIGVNIVKRSSWKNR
jgi:hypothetical protein